MKSLFLCFLIFINCVAISQPLKNEPKQKYILKVSPVLKFNWSTSKKAKNTNYYPSNLITGMNLNFLFPAKKNNKHEVGMQIGFIPKINSKQNNIISFSGNQIGVEYSYRLIRVVKTKTDATRFEKSPTFNLFAGIGTEFLFTKIDKNTRNMDFQINKTTTKSVEQNIVFSPGFQVCKKNFFFDFSVPVSFGYKYQYRKNDIDNPILLGSDTFTKYNLFNWNVECKVGVGAKF